MQIMKMNNMGLNMKKKIKSKKKKKYNHWRKFYKLLNVESPWAVLKPFFMMSLMLKIQKNYLF